MHLLGFFFATPLTAAVAAAGAAAVPIVIHLLNRRRHVVVDWAAMRFLLAAQKKNTRRVRLEQFLLLAVRVLVVLLVALAMAAVAGWAEPLWQRLLPGALRPAAASGRTHHVIVIDGSYSMAADADGGTRFAAALRAAEGAIDDAGPGDGFSVVALGSPAEALVPGPAPDGEKVAREVRNLPVPHGAADLAGGLNLVADILSRSPARYRRKRVVFLTDIQRTMWSLPEGTSAAESGPRRAFRDIAAAAQLVFVDVSGGDRANLAIEDFRLLEDVPLAGVPLAATATVRNHSARPRDGVRVSLYAGRSDPAAPPGPAALIRKGEGRVVTIPPGGAVPVTFAVTAAVPGEYLLQVRVEADGLPLDDRRSLVARVRETAPVLLVDGRPSGEPLARAAGWLAKALFPFADGESAPARYAARPVVLPRRLFADARRGSLIGFRTAFFCDAADLTPAEARRIDAHLRRGGNVVFGLGPNAARGLAGLNDVLHNGGDGPLPARLDGVVAAGPDAHYTLAADPGGFAKPPLDAFRSDDDRAALLSARFRKFVRVEAGDGRAVLRFAPGGAKGDTPPGGPALIEWRRGRGRVLLFTSSFNADWNSWPVSPTFPPFMYQVFLYLEADTGGRSGVVGDDLAAYFPIEAAGRDATVRAPDGGTRAVRTVVRDDAALLLVESPRLSGVYLADAGGGVRRLFALNVPARGEGDLSRLADGELRALAPDGDVAVVTPGEAIPPPDPSRAPGPSGDDPAEAEPLDPLGPEVARYALLAALCLMVIEVILAWRLGAARSAGVGSGNGPRWRFAGFVVAALVLLTALGAAALVHAEATGRFLGFLPGAWRESVESGLGVPPAAPGEDTAWGLNYRAYITGSARTDLWLAVGFGAALVLLIVAVYRAETRALGRGRPSPGWRGWVWHPMVPLSLLRACLFAAMLAVLLPQLRLAFARESRPEVVVIIDDSASMGEVDAFNDEAVRAAAAELAGAVNADRATRLRLAQALLTRDGGAWLRRLLEDRRVSVRVYRASGRHLRLADAASAGEIGDAVEAVNGLSPTGRPSRLGDAVRAVLKAYRGGSLAAVVLISDGVVRYGRGEARRRPADEDLADAGKRAARQGVPLFTVGVGDSVAPFDLAVGDVRVDDVVRVNDRLIFEGRVTAVGPAAKTSAPVTVRLEEKRGDGWRLVASEAARPRPDGRPAKVRVRHAPTEAGEKLYRLVIPVRPGEQTAENNAVERPVLVTEAKRLRVLYVEGYPRYQFRFLKTLLEREALARGGRRSVELKVVQLDADPKHFLQDRSTLAAMPTRRELFRDYDVVILGDVDPRRQLPNADANLTALADFVRVRGGGLLMVAGRRASPRSFKGTPLAEVLPVRMDVPEPDPPAGAVTADYRPALTPVGSAHPAFRLEPGAAESAAAWDDLAPMLWFATGYRRKLSAEVLAVHPARPAESALRADGGEEHPLALQQFFGAGRVMFLGFDGTWRWRRDGGAARFNQFWLQAIRALARTRLSRTELRADRQTAYREGEPIRLTVRFPDDAPPPGRDRVTVSAERRGPDGPPERQTLELAKVKGSRATYEGLLKRTPVGRYRFELSDPMSGDKRPSAEARVVPTPGEADRPHMDEAALKEAAAASGGKYYRLDTADGLPGDLPEGPRVALDEPRPPYRLWDHPGVFALVLALFLAEWAFRKRARLA